MTLRSLEATEPAPRERAREMDLTVAAQEHRPDAAPLSLRGLHKRWRKDLPLVLDDLDLILEPGTTTWEAGATASARRRCCALPRG